ncbi:MAG: YsnF/AvaK domain-containing protein, partial [Acetobacteraceae bacterium]|nr:YsnF/AvaK domain-containing protein [Acetobacteraceae bacterium]
IPVYEEQLRVGKREVGRGSVRVRSYVVEQPVHEQVQLREERVHVERRPVDRPADIAGTAEPFRERTIEVTATAEEAVIAKEARVKEEIVVGKDTQERTETVSDTVRRTEVEVEDDRARKPAPTPKP